MQPRRLARLARRQCALFTRGQAAACGYDSHAVRRRVDAGTWVEYNGRVLSDAGVPDTWERRVQAASLGAPPGTVLADWAAAWVHGLSTECNGREIVLLGPPGQQIASRGVRVRTSVSLDDTERTRVGLMLVTTVARTIVDLARSADADIDELLADALRRGLVQLGEVVEVVERRRRFPGRRRIVGALRRVDPDVARLRSALEHRALRLIRKMDIPQPLVNHPVHDSTGALLGIADLCWPSLRLIVELDGHRFHATPGELANDSTRQNRLVLAGWRVIRLTWDDVMSGRATAIIAAAVRDHAA